MQRSRSRKLARLARETNVRPVEHRFSKLVRHASIGAAVVAAISAAHAQAAAPNTVNPSASGAQVQQVAAAATPPNATSAAATAAADQGGLQEVIVTATKEAVNIQALPMTVTAITGAQLATQNVQNFAEMANNNPQIHFVSGSPAGVTIEMRGIGSGGGGFGGGTNSTTIYLNGQPQAVGGSAVNWHLYDMARVETLPGPQGTLYGAASEAGTLREITNQPDLSHFSAGYTTQLNTIYNGTLGGTAEGFVNIPFTSNFGGRFVGWYERDSGFVNNVHQKVTYDNGFVLDNAPFVTKDDNPATVEGGRAEFTYKLNDDWSINPMFMTQRSRWDGNNEQESWRAGPSVGTAIPSSYSVAYFSPQYGNDSSVDTTLSVLGKIGDFNVTLDSGYLSRDTRTFSEYADYSLAYQSLESFLPHNPTMYDPRWNSYEIISNELHVTTPTDWPVHGIVGIYQDRDQAGNYLQEPVPGMNPVYEVGYGTPYAWPETIYLDNLQTVNRDWAAFTQMTWDITHHLSATAGFRRFRYENTIQGFYGYSAAYALKAFGSTHTSGQDLCEIEGNSTPRNGAPCTDENTEAESWGSVPLFSLSYKFDPDHLVYAIFTKGYRPGGPNRTFGVLPYAADFMTDYEVGTKTAWLNHRLIFNADAFLEQWKNYQFGFTGPNGIGETANAGDADSKGWDETLQWLITSGLTASLNVSYADGYLVGNYCGFFGTDGKPITSANCTGPGHTTPKTPKAPDGQRLPGDALWSGFASLRYTFPFANGTAFAEADQNYRSQTLTQLEPSMEAIYGPVPAYGLTNISVGLDKNNWELELLVTNLFNRDAIIGQGSTLQASAEISQFSTIQPPRLIGIQWSQNF